MQYLSFLIPTWIFLEWFKAPALPLYLLGCQFDPSRSEEIGCQTFSDFSQQWLLPRDTTGIARCWTWQICFLLSRSHWQSTVETHGRSDESMMCEARFQDKFGLDCFRSLFDKSVFSDLCSNHHTEPKGKRSHADPVDPMSFRRAYQDKLFQTSQGFKNP